MPNHIDYRKIAQVQQTDSELQTFIDNSKGLQFKKIAFPDYNIPLYCDLSTSTTRFYIPKLFQEKVFVALHDLAHSDVWSTPKIIRSRVVLPSI